ncbi:MAG: FAD-dependent oxidoreductase [Paracoccaceae bacterium]|nr:FAD-dependent oxidoreductase [Paracoccaceae bacterium]
MKIAIIGSGIAGLGAAYALSQKYDITLYERDSRFGGHANTEVINVEGEEIAVDTGFIVYNEVNYPNLTALFAHLGTPTKPSDMSFGFSMKGGQFEYACDNLNKIFAQRLNILKPSFWGAFRDVMRFIKIAPQQLANDEIGDISLGDWLKREGFGELFRDGFILPMGGAIWSTPTDKMTAFPARNLLTFFDNHDLYTGLAAAIQWRTVDGGSHAYVDQIIEHLGPNAQTNRAVTSVIRLGGKVEINFADGERDVVDQVIFACHAPDACAMLNAQDPEEAEVLGAFHTTQNTAILHRDPSLMPKRKKVWSSWSMITDDIHNSKRLADEPVSLTYWMNRLQTLPTNHDIFVTLNAQRRPDPALTIAEYSYAHPGYDSVTFAAQARLDNVQGRGGVWYAGAWTGWGFHEDGLKSGLRVAAALGARPDWAADLGAPLVTFESRIAAE